MTNQVDFVAATGNAEAEAMDAYSRAVSGAAERAGPAVVKVEVKGPRPPETRGRGGRRPRGSRPEREDGFQAAGSGVIFDSHGRIITNDHVVRVASGPDAISVVLSDGRRLPAAVVFADPSVVIAVICVIRASSNLPLAD